MQALLQVARTSKGPLADQTVCKWSNLHQLAVKSYMSPTNCDHCGKMLIGFSKQGLQCSRCEVLGRLPSQTAFPHSPVPTDSAATVQVNVHKHCAQRLDPKKAKNPRARLHCGQPVPNTDVLQHVCLSSFHDLKATILISEYLQL